jgi:hypothetical protein
MQFRDKHYVWQFARDAMYVSLFSHCINLILYVNGYELIFCVVVLSFFCLGYSQLYGYELNRHQQLGKIYPINNGTTVFETNQSLIDNGMLESVILAITLLLSERFRD